MDSALDDFLKRFGDDDVNKFMTQNQKNTNITSSMAANYLKPQGLTNVTTPGMSKITVNTDTVDTDRVPFGLDGQEGKKGMFSKTGLANIGSIAGQIGNAMPNSQVNTHGGDESLQQANDGMNAAKDAVGSAVPIAGMFRGIEKGVVNVAGSTHGEEGAAISQAMFSPSSNVMNIAKNKEMSGGEKTMAYLQTVFNPIGAGIMINRANQKRKNRIDVENNQKEDYFEKKKREEEYLQAEGLASLNNLKALREKQLGIIS